MNHTVKTRDKICRYLLPIVAGTLFCTGCAEEASLQEATQNNRVTVVDYTVDEVLTRSVSHAPLPAHERIQSLTYLLYDESNGLLKQREIPGIDQMQEGDWPMKRSTMTWEQREALKDTLNQKERYTAVFIANTNPALFGGEEVLHLTKKIDGTDVPASLEEVYLSLPRTQAFDDHNMFYLCVCEIIPGPENNREHPLNCPVMLQRVVSRTDFFSNDYPEWDSDFTRGKIQEFTEKVYGELIPVTTDKMPFGINEWLKSFTDAFALMATEKGWMGVLTFPAWITDFTRTLNTLDYSGYIRNITSDDVANIKNKFYTSCLQHEKLKKLWQPWKGLQAKVAYNGCADRFYVSTRTSGSDIVAAIDASPLLDIVQMPEANGEPAQHSFTLIEFGENPDTTNENVQNKMKEVRLYETADTETPVSIIPLPEDMQSFAGQGGNERIQLKYQPIKTLTYNKEVTSGTTCRLAPINLKGSISAGMGSFDLHKDWLQEFFSSEKGRKYGESIEKFVLEITLPDLSRPEALTVEPEWTLKQPTR